MDQTVFQELQKENLLSYAIQGCRAVLEKQLGIKNIIFTMSETYRQEMVRRAVTAGKEIRYPITYIVLNALAGVKDQQNNAAVRKHGIRFETLGERATTKKGYIFPITLGMEFHYIDSDSNRILTMAQSLAILSVTSGCSFRIQIGQMLEYLVRLEIPLDSSIPIQEEQNEQTPGGTEITANLVVHTQIGFFRDVSAVSGAPIMMDITLQSGDTQIDFQVEVGDV
jgi:hypothetical protein